MPFLFWLHGGAPTKLGIYDKLGRFLTKGEVLIQAGYGFLALIFLFLVRLS